MRLVRDGAAEHADEVRPVHAVHRRPAGGVRRHDRRDPGAVVAVVSRSFADPAAGLVDRLGQPEPVQQAHAVRSDQHAGADLAEFGRLLVDRRLDARPRQRGRGREPADSAAHHRRRQPFSHQHNGIIT
jgi:hypothetical protein